MATSTPASSGAVSHGQTIKTLPVGKFVTLTKISPTGSLQVRRQKNGAVTFYWRYSIGTKSERVPIGDYDSSAPPKSLQPTAKGYAVSAAIYAAGHMAQDHKTNLAIGGRPALVAAKALADQQANSAKHEAAQFTLESLLTQYCDYLQTLGRISHRDARSIFKIHVVEAWPAIASLPANQISAEQIADMMRNLLEMGKGRTANKLRSYMRSAYQVAKASRSKPSIPIAFKSFKVMTNPAADTEPDESQNKPDKNPLSVHELRTYWTCIKAVPGFKGALLRLHLLTGGQRIEQLVNLRTTDAGDDSILLFDGKGRPGKPARPHIIPLIDEAVVALMECEPLGEYALSTDGGQTHVSASTLSAWAMEAAEGIEGFQTKRIRSGVETLLASANISADHRGRLQSHGISGVQSRHYDGHDYMAEKRNALKTLLTALENK